MPWELKPDRPIYAQLIEQLQLLVISGIYPPGSKLPSVRELAAEASVNPNTMQRALAKLEDEGLLFSQRTSGRFVTEDAGRIVQTKRDLAEKLTREFLGNMGRLGYDARGAVSLLERITKEEEQNG
ncbi:MAG TPA: GntR family transcriptional regulator [Ruminococcaceae bacterium]|jgi:DNA-binding transcriptional regulator YhcF (GntR family)|nr:GntR family transcriptional regulator [Oscillospiraceae bacterium]HBG55664.1 GntR family transcriptional regulator [Oscillospiraceae bacterium]HBQ46013.1 GntR family transcriptional regulator [Oscillospiraceae bacterium]HBT91588.1 GntR family transcriptional regulator [Oscillospiraceae bacterium]HCB91816.1 GntR family transcriptional regulator [Oscillospiraceae bacterium]